MTRDERRTMWQTRIETFKASGESNVTAWCATNDIPISIEKFVNKHCKNNPEENPVQFRESLIQAVKDKKKGATCTNCGQEIAEVCWS